MADRESSAPRGAFRLRRRVDPDTATTAAEHRGGLGRLEVDGEARWALTHDAVARLDRLPIAWDLATDKLLSDRWLRLDHGNSGRALRALDDDRIALAELEGAKTIALLEGVNWPCAAPQLAVGARFAFGPLVQSAERGARPTPFTTIWDLATGARPRTIDEPTLLGAGLGADRLVTVSDRHQLSVWDLASGQRLHALRGAGGRPSLLCVDASSSRAVTIATDGALTVWDLEGAGVVAQHDSLAALHGGVAAHVRLLGGQRLLCEGWFVDVLDLETGTLDRSWCARDPNRDRILEIAPLADGEHVAVLISRGLFDPTTLEVWHVDEQALAGSIEADCGRALVLAAGHAVIAYDEHVEVFALEPRPLDEAPEAPAVPDAVRRQHAKATTKKAAKKKATKKKATKKKAAKKVTKKKATKKKATKKPRARR
ncbi:MAG: hypothetical protein KC503_06315 [Myxococcales bacterium]|nr:hypothetical protein [Myxococcales bacterium]